MQFFKLLILFVAVLVPLQVKEASLPSAPVVVELPKKQCQTLEECKEVFFEVGKKEGVDPYLLMAIAYLESSFGRYIPPGSYNPFGRKCQRGYQCVKAFDNTDKRNYLWNAYSSFEDAIEDEARYIRREYIEKGLTTPCQIGAKYAEDPQWCLKIQAIIRKLKNVDNF